MAKPWLPLFTLLCISHFTTIFTRTLPNTLQTTTFDVSSSLPNTQNLLSFTQSIQPQESQSAFTMQLHSRVSLQKSVNADYRSLTLARLVRDSVRVRSITARLDLAVNGVAKSDMKPVDKVYEAADLESPVVSGTSQGSGEYFSRIGIGKPAKEVYVVLDTGSDVNWLQCAPCADCYQQSDPIFEPDLSSSYAPLTCATRECKSLDVSECRNGSCLYEVSYGDGSYTVGDFVTETVSFGGSGSASVDNIAIGCGHNNEGLFVGAAGLLGLGGGALSFPSQLNASSFSYCLVDRDSDSASTLEFNSVTPPNTVTAPLLRNRGLDTFYYLGVTGLSVGGELLPIPRSTFHIDENGSGGIIIDSGTAVTRLQSDVYDSLRDAFVKGTQHLASANGVALFDTCYDLSEKTSVEVPTVAFHFPASQSLSLPAKNYLIPVDSEGTFCFAFAPTTSQLSIIGNVQQQGTRVNLDLDNAVVGFSPNSC